MQPLGTRPPSPPLAYAPVYKGTLGHLRQGIIVSLSHIVDGVRIVHIHLRQICFPRHCLMIPYRGGIAGICSMPYTFVICKTFSLQSELCIAPCEVGY